MKSNLFKNCALLFVSIMIALLVAEFAFPLFSQENIHNRGMHEEFKCRIRDSLLGSYFKPNCKSRWVRKQRDRVLFDFMFSTDHLGRRIVPMTSFPRRKISLFFGGSFVLGAGVNDNETLPYFFSKFLSHYKSYNYGGSGFGPQHMLASLEEKHISDEIQYSGEDVSLFYLFLPFHISRAVGTIDITNRFGRHFPYYDYGDDKTLKRKGSFESGRPFKARLYSLIWKSRILKFFFSHVLTRDSEKDLLLTYKIIEQAYKKFQGEFKSKNFYVILYPTYNVKITKKIITLLKSSKIKYLDYSNELALLEEDFKVGDGHPNAKAYAHLAKKMMINFQ